MLNSAANEILAREVESVLARHEASAHKSPLNWTVWRHSIFAGAYVVVLLGAIIESWINRSPGTFDRWIYAEWVLLAETIFLIAVAGWNGWLVWRENRFVGLEMIRRIRSLLSALPRVDLSLYQDNPPPRSRQISLYRVLRDGKFSLLPSSLIVEGDIVELMFGDFSPCLVTLCAQASGFVLSLDFNQAFTPQLLLSQTDQMSINELPSTFQFQATETSYAKIIGQVLGIARPCGVMTKQLAIIESALYTRILPFILGLSLVFNIIRLALSTGGADVTSASWWGILFYFTALPIAPILPWSLITFGCLVKTYGDSRVLALFDHLQQSQTPFDDDADVDQFDEEAPPPTKDVKLTHSVLYHYFKALLMHKADVPVGSYRLLETLSNVSTICCFDRDGTVAEVHYRPEELFFFHGETSDADTSVELEFSLSSSALEPAQQLTSPDWSRYTSTLKPLGLNLFMLTTCDEQNRLQRSRKNEFVRKQCKSAFQFSHNDSLSLHDLCSLTRELGFSNDSQRRFRFEGVLDVIMKNHQPSTSSYDRQDRFELSRIGFRCLKDLASDGRMVMAEGSVPAILSNCQELWDGKNLVELTDMARKLIMDFYHSCLVNDLICVGYSYGPVELPQNPLAPNTSSKPRSMLMITDEISDKNTSRTVFNIIEDQPQIFLDVIAFGVQAKQDVKEFIEDSRLAGIRFVLFSDAPERESKAFAARLGLETDWNSCILLSAEKKTGARADYLEPHDIKAKLPRGIENIRPHLQSVDDIPLHVSLFADCTTETKVGMIEIFQEYGEVACGFGTALNQANTSAFAAVDLAVATITCGFKQLSLTSKAVSAVSLGMSLNAVPATLAVHSDTSPYVLSQIIREARNYSRHGAQIFVFVVGAAVTMAVLGGLSNVTFLPPVYSSFHVIWLMFIILPLLTLSFMFSPDDKPDVMKLMPVKNLHTSMDFSRHCVYYLLRFLPVVIYSFAVFVVALWTYAPAGMEVFTVGQTAPWLHSDNSGWAVIYAQTAAMYAFTVLIVIISGTFLNRTESLVDFLPLKNRAWILMALLCIALQTIFSYLILRRGPFVVTDLALYLGLMAGVAVVALAVQEVVKTHDRKEYARFQKRSKLEFNTKLGCYSPV